MADRRRKRLAIGWTVLLVVSLIGLAVFMFSDLFLDDPFNAYGEVSVPGSRTLHLPAGDVKVSFHTETVGTLDAGELPTPPDLEISINPPSGVAAPQFSRNVGDTAAVNQDAHIRVGVAHIPSAGDYTIKTNGQTNAFLSPRVSFGRDTLNLDFLPWSSVVLLLVSLVGLMAARNPPQRRPAAAPRKTPLQELSRIAALRDSGALSEEEYEDEKRRLLDGL